MVIPVRLERTTLSLEGRCSIQLSYGTPTNLLAGPESEFKLLPARDDQNVENHKARYQGVKGPGRPFLEDLEVEIDPASTLF